MDSGIAKLIQFASDNSMNVTGFDELSKVVYIDDRPFMPLLDYDKLFKSDMTINVGSYLESEALGAGADYVFEFGGYYYWTPSKTRKLEFNDFRYIGRAVSELGSIGSHLGVHGGYEIMNGSGSYDSWCSKAKFLGHTSLGICEHNTLAGAVAFQSSCKDYGIKPVIGMTVDTIRSCGWTAQVKLYAKDKRGWRNLLRIHKHLHIDSDNNTVPWVFLIENSEGLAVVINWGSQVKHGIISDVVGMDAYYQIDSIVYSDVLAESDMLNNVKDYLEEYVVDLPPIMINDTYYLDKDYAHIKTKLNSSIGRFVRKCSNAHYKTADETFTSLCDLFDESDDRVFSLYEMAVDNLSKVASSVKFKIEMGVVKMPKFDCKDVSGEFSGCETNEELIWKVLERGLYNVVDGGSIDLDKYYSRIEMEMSVIKKGGFIDYFLVVWDIINWSLSNGIYTGLGRGSAGGSLVSYLMGITRIDPMVYDLPFERFMNEGRLVGSLPDIDSDFEGLRRDDVKRYIEAKYGADYVCSIGSYSKLRVKAAMNEMWADKSKNGTIKYMTAMILDRDGNWDEIFKSALKKPAFKQFVCDNVDFINNVRLVLDQPKNESVHAAAVVIVPREDADGNPMTIFDWMPVTKRDGVLISEWEGTYIEKCGFLKNDILGTRQLDKFRYMTDLIKETTGDEVDIYSIPTDDPKVYALFQDGNTEDTFHFGSTGLKSYTRSVKPVVIDDLIDTISLHRPALMDIGMHKEFVNIRFGRTKAKYDFMLEGVTKSTNGILVYQEQVMEAVKIIGGFTMQEADDVRRAMGKKKIEVIAPYKEQFVAGAMSRGLDRAGADALWNKLELFSGYGFNRAHATAYALTGYVGMWFKVNYPLQFWTAAFQYAKDDDIPKFVSEMNRVGDVNIAPPNINTSEGEFTTDYESNTIHWSLNKIKQVGDIATDEVVEDRTVNGKYFSVEELFKRVTRKKVNRKVITSMIFAGCMDSLYNVKKPSDRYMIFKEYAGLIGEPVSNMVSIDVAAKSYWWTVKQKMVSGLGRFDFKQLLTEVGFVTKFKIVDATDIQFEDSIGIRCAVGGIVVDTKTHMTKNGEFANICIDSNDELVWITCWSDTWSIIKNSINAGDNVKMLFITGTIEYSDFRGINVITTAKSSNALVIDTGIIGKAKS